MLSETIAIAHHNTYNHFANLTGDKYVHGNRDIGAMLAPHFTDLIAINHLARVTLIAPMQNTLSGFFGVRGEDFAAVMAGWYTKKDNLWNEDVGFYDELKTRGFNPDTF